VIYTERKHILPMVPPGDGDHGFTGSSRRVAGNAQRATSFPGFRNPATATSERQIRCRSPSWRGAQIMKPAVPKPQRCAINTRKSTEHNLDLEMRAATIARHDRSRECHRRRSAVCRPQPRRYARDYSMDINIVDGRPDIQAYCLRIDGRDLYEI
jgi:hypothetical protein